MSNDFTRMAKRIRQLPTWIEELVDAEIGDVFDSMARAARRKLIQEGSVTSDPELLTSIHHVSGASNVRGKTGYATHVVRADAPHAAFVEYGTGVRQRGSPVRGERFKSPSVPPTGAILEWMEQKGVTPRMSVEGGDDMLFAAQQIAETVARYGQQPHPYMRPAWHRHRAQISRAHARGVRRALKRL
ncbi:hypothetical protein PN419_00330 [Halorubrum ezzemoulense]|uniref:hypothetical protein n=1 Tax=Halorubrum ezzemoulense TaxID=337243 RepID=UPI00232C1E12|nr:hypothetical protein [Halorubrum ezzemoulense]MDB9247453.1 hypothetical protein [Halorubrum ezzemoulense]MDB9258638.1 hypothetical protein [Halorubrum ezzemoulense]MDB9264504.1 hypothetical protein [Halorubrum ezzemoulense]MDB9268999.1 hypothetical protein [Halorubrum ezzemoulense]MDB9271472.1 hypothetical protein [Halorubrum ezzemoulense]